MSEIEKKKEVVAGMLSTANHLDELGHVAAADTLTRQAKKIADEIEDDQDIEDADSPVAEDGDPFSKGFGRSFKNFSKKAKSICDSANLMKKLTTLNAACGDKGDVRKIRNLIEELCDELAKVCKE